jgi:hypothetical protein
MLEPASVCLLPSTLQWTLPGAFDNLIVRSDTANVWMTVASTTPSYEDINPLVLGALRADAPDQKD